MRDSQRQMSPEVRDREGQLSNSVLPFFSGLSHLNSDFRDAPSSKFHSPADIEILGGDDDDDDMGGGADAVSADGNARRANTFFGVTAGGQRVGTSVNSSIALTAMTLLLLGRC